MADIAFHDAADAAAWAKATPEDRGDLFNLGRRLWERRHEVLVDEALGEATRTADGRVRTATEEGDRLRHELKFDLAEALRDAGMRKAEIQHLREELQVRGRGRCLSPRS